MLGGAAGGEGGGCEEEDTRRSGGGCARGGEGRGREDEDQGHSGAGETAEDDPVDNHHPLMGGTPAPQGCWRRFLPILDCLRLECMDAEYCWII